MLVLRKVAVTGGLSCGKSLVCKLLKEKGAFYVSADDLVHNFLFSDSFVQREVVFLLGEEILTEGHLDRAKIAKKVFNNQHLLLQLEQLLHPLVFKEIEQLYEKIKDQRKYSLFVVEVPLLYEAGFAEWFDEVILVIAPTECAKKWAEQKKNISKQEFDKRSARFWSQKEKKGRASYTITNNSTLDSLQLQVEALYLKLTK